MSALVPYVGRTVRQAPAPVPRAARMRVASCNPPRHAVLDEFGEAMAFRLWERDGLDTIEIAWRLECTPAAAANALARARDRGRG